MRFYEFGQAAELPRLITRQSRADSFSAFAATTLRAWSTTIATNRAPYDRSASGALRRGAGGVITAMLAVAEATGATWVSCARNDAERLLAQELPEVVVQPPGRLPITQRYAITDATTYDKYYGVVSNPLLWFIQHYLWQLAYEPVIDDAFHDAWRSGYVAVNSSFADAIVASVSRSPRHPLVMFQDYHLYIAPRMVRERLPHSTLQHFIHIPWPTPQYWTVLPREIRNAIMYGLLANDVIGFQTNRDVRNFLAGCEELMGLRVDHRERAVTGWGRVAWVRSYPASVDVPFLKRLASSREVQVENAVVSQWRPEKLIVRIDRTDPIKNIIRGFLAYERMLLHHRELAGRVQFWAFLQPSRQDIAVYTDYLSRVRSEAARINAGLGHEGWQPIRLELGESLKRAVAAYKSFDVLLVNSIYDGMNLVAKEGMLVNERDGVLVLSENAGAHEQLGENALSINPFDVGATAEALYKGLMMPAPERQARGLEIRRQIEREDISNWLQQQLEDIRELAPVPR